MVEVTINDVRCMILHVCKYFKKSASYVKLGSVY